MPKTTFMGYRRPDGRVGIRNHVLILPTSTCASDTAERIALGVGARAVVGVHVRAAGDAGGRRADVLAVLHDARARGDVGAGDLVEQGDVLAHRQLLLRAVRQGADRDVAGGQRVDRDRDAVAAVDDDGVSHGAPLARVARRPHGARTHQV